MCQSGIRGLTVLLSFVNIHGLVQKMLGVGEIRVITMNPSHHHYHLAVRELDSMSTYLGLVLPVFSSEDMNRFLIHAVCNL
jgi:hypothetical protein